MDRNKIILKGSDKSKILEISLIDILNTIEGLTHELNWSLLWIESTTSDKNFNMLEFEELINNSERGKMYNIQELHSFFSTIDDITELLLIADFSPEKLKRYQSDEEMYSTCFLCIELLDSSFWQIHSLSTTILNKLRDLDE